MEFETYNVTKVKSVTTVNTALTFKVQRSEPDWQTSTFDVQFKIRELVLTVSSTRVYASIERDFLSLRERTEVRAGRPAAASLTTISADQQRKLFRPAFLFLGKKTLWRQERLRLANTTDAMLPAFVAA